MNEVLKEIGEKQFGGSWDAKGNFHTSNTSNGWTFSGTQSFWGGEKVFAFFPIKLQNGKWLWWKKVMKWSNDMNEKDFYYCDIDEV